MVSLSLNAKSIWGRTITYLRETKNVALQLCCGDINDVEIENDKLLAKTFDESIYNMINNNYSIDEIQKAFKWLGYSLKFEIVLKEKLIDAVEEDINKLKNLFGDILKIT